MATPWGPASPSNNPVSPLINPLPPCGLFANSDFESMTHEQLHAMVKDAVPDKAAVLGLKLNAAQAALTKTAEALKVHMSQVEWEGEGGEAFRTWGADFANAVLRVGKLSGTAGEWMGHAVQTLHEVHGQMPEVSSSARATLDAYLNNHKGRQVGAVAPPLQDDQNGSTLPSGGPTQKQAYEAQQRLEADRTRAAELMKKLAESYSWSAHNIGVAERPSLKPLPERIVAPLESSPHRGSEYIQSGGDGPQGGSRYGDSSAATAGPRPQTTDQSMPGLVSPAERHGGAVPDHKASTEIDGLGTLPTLPSPPTADQIGSRPGGGPAHGQSPLPIALPPMVGSGRGRAPSIPNVPRISMPTPSALPSEKGVGIARPGQAVPRIPDPGIVGGRPVPPGSERPASQIPRGTVIGAEPSRGEPQGRAPMGAGSAFGGAGSPAGGRPNMGGGRRLATEPGGVVGGRPSQRSGVTGDRPFTPGGTGLVRTRPSAEGSPSRPNGMQSQGFPLSSSGGAGSRRRREGQRPDYLVEDEETWSPDSPRLVPRVID